MAFLNRKTSLLAAFVLCSALITSCSVGQGQNTSSGANTSAESFSLEGSWTGTAYDDVNSLALDSTTLVATAGYYGLLTFDVTTPAQISNLSRYPAAGSLPLLYPYNDVVIRNSYSLVSAGMLNGAGGLVVISNSDPTNLGVHVASVAIAGRNNLALEASSDGQTVYSADGGGNYSKYTINFAGPAIANPNNYSLSGRIPFDIAFGTNLFLACGPNGVIAADPAAGTLQYTILYPLTYARAVACNSTLLAVADLTGVFLYDISGKVPVYLGSYKTGISDPTDIIIYGSDIYVSDNSSGILKIQYTPPATFTLVKKYESGYTVKKLLYSSTTGCLYAACGKNGILILK